MSEFFLMDNNALLDNGAPLDLNEDIKTLIAERMEKGRKAYGHGLLPNAGYDWVQEALEEALDLAIYVSAKLLEIKKLTDTNAKQSGESRASVSLEHSHVAQPEP